MNYYPTLAEVEDIATNPEFKTIPVSLRIPLQKTAVEVCEIFKNVSRNVFVLESCEDSKVWGRYSFLGLNPTLAITCLDGKLEITSGTTVTIDQVKPHEYIRQIIRENRSPRIEGLPTFTGGLVGYFSYDFIKYSEPKLELDAFDEEGFQDVDLMLFDKVVAIDHLEQEIILIVNIKTDEIETNYNRAKLELNSMMNLVILGSPKKEKRGKLLSELKPVFNKEEFCAMVEKAKKYIYEGDIFQVVLSNRLSARYDGSIFHVYDALKKKNPSPYMFYFSSNTLEIAGASPETLVKIQGRDVLTFPLAGTKPRGKTLEEDKELEMELLSDEKERAEHNMLVDLGRNDVGKISEFGSVSVDKYMNIERFSHVMHIGSTVHGTLREDKDALDAIDAILPAGTLSGAPKIRACEIINELENVKRGIYGGAIGYIDFNGNMDTCIAIRLVFKKNGKVFVRSGAGIVADSVPESEYMECINKAKATMLALEGK